MKTSPILGSHVSAAGGLHRAVERAIDVGCSCVQVFTKNNNQWRAKPLVDSDVNAWQEALAESGLRHPIAHASYLINLASPKPELLQKSIDGLVVEWERANLLGLEGLVVHPGAFTDSSEAEGLERIVEAVIEVIGRVDVGSCRLLLENTAGQGSCLGHTFSQLAFMIDGIQTPDRVGLCLDTCHAFAAGYEINEVEGIQAMRKEIDDRFPFASLETLPLR